MLPGLRNGDYVIVLRWLRGIKAGDVVVAQHHSLGVIIKRVKAVTNAKNYILMGDNTAASTRSEDIGAVTKQQIQGRVLCTVKAPVLA